jgi:XTP/dITP diphosphohydrolase
MKKTLLLVTSNEHKLHEFKELIDSDRFEIISLKEVGYTQEIIEDQVTYHEQAVKKVEALINLYPEMIIIADDSGIEIEAFDYGPGVYSARFKLEMSQHQRNEWICNQVQQNQKKHAAFVCAIACYVKEHPIFVTVNRCFGEISSEPTHDYGFGYDPIFIPDGYNDTFQTLPKTVKNKISHRALAIASLMTYLRGLS